MEDFFQKIDVDSDNELALEELLEYFARYAADAAGGPDGSSAEEVGADGCLPPLASGWLFGDQDSAAFPGAASRVEYVELPLAAVTAVHWAHDRGATSADLDFQVDCICLAPQSMPNMLCPFALSAGVCRGC